MSNKSPSTPGRPAAETPQRLIVRSSEPPMAGDSMMGANDTAVAGANTSMTMPAAKAGDVASTSEIIGSTLSGRYLVTRKVGQGGMGAVYEATHTLIGKRVAVKVLLEKYAKREAIVQRLEQEAKLASSVGNEHIIDITDFGQTEDGRTFVVMEFLEGESLAECLARETKLPEQRILRIAAQAASALAAAHDKGVVHRDIKPENLFLLRRKDKDFVKVVDFGISKSLRSTGEDEEVPRLTQTGMVLGTPLYMSPEQARGDDDLDHRVDIYALGVIMYEVATGRVPFVGNNYLSVISQVLNEPAKPVRELSPELTEEFEAIVQRAMAKHRNDRYDNAAALLEDLNALLDDPTHSTERARITGPRRKPKPGNRGLRIVGWIAGVCGIIAAVAITVSVTMSSGDEKKAQNATIDAGVLKMQVDAAVIAPPVAIDAAIPTIALEVIPDPPEAELYEFDELLGAGRQTVKFVVKDKEILITARLAGYEDAIVKFNPADEPDRKKPINIRMQKSKPTPQNTPPTQRPLPKDKDKDKPKDPGKGSGEGSGKAIEGSEGNPFKKGS